MPRATFLFSDIEGSTRLWERYPEAMQAHLARHDLLLRRAVESSAGRVFKTVGDGFYAVFSDPLAALQAALAAQRSLHAENWGDLPLRVRIGLHSGPAQERDRDYFGPTLNRLARVLASAHGGQVLLTGPVQEAVCDHLPPGCSLLDLGPRRLRDLEQPIRIFQLVAPDLPTEFSPLRTLESVPNNLPLQLTRFVGRAVEKSEADAWLRSSGVRLLTLTGAGGTGKTRLALQVAADLLDVFPDGVWFVELAPVTQPDLVAQAVAAALGLRDEPALSEQDSLLAFLRPRTILLVLDNCEHLVHACARLAQTLLRQAPRLSIMATSREALGLPGEQVLPVPPLAVPGPQGFALAPPPAGARLQALGEFEALQLFLDRAHATIPSFVLTADNARAIVEVCRRLDGIPLALELAAARLTVLSVQELASRLADTFPRLGPGSRTALARQQTLQSLIDWSYNLLSQDESALFRRLSVFSGGWTLAAAEQVAGPPLNSDTAGDRGEILDLLSSLVSKSLALAKEQSGQVRYRQLETIRQYGLDRLRQAGELSVLRTRQLNFYLQLAEQAEANLHGRTLGSWLERLDQEHDNLAAAVEWALERGQAEANPGPALRLSTSLWRFWQLRGYWQEGAAALRRALDLPGGAEPSLQRARALDAAGHLAFAMGESQAAGAFFSAGLAAATALGDRREIANASLGLGRLAQSQGDYTGAHTLLKNNLLLFRELGDRAGMARTQLDLGIILLYQQQYPTAQDLFGAALATFRELGDDREIGMLLGNLGLVAYYQSDYAAAAGLYSESLARLRQLGDRPHIAAALTNFGYAALRLGDRAGAAASLREAVALYQEMGDRRNVGDVLMGLAAVATESGDGAHAARLVGAAEGLAESMGAQIDLANHAEYQGIAARALACAGPELFASARAEGRVLSFDGLVELAYRDLARTIAPAPSSASGEPVRTLAAPGVPELTIRAFGRTEVHRGDRLLSSSDWKYSKARELLLFLLLHPPRSKEQIGVALWPEASPAQLHNNFRVVVHHLRQALGSPGWVLFQDEQYLFNQDLPHSFDVTAFEAHLARTPRLLPHDPAAAAQAWQAALALYRGDLMDDFAEGEWYLPRREELRRSYLGALLSLGRLRLDSGEYPAAVECYRAAVAADPFLEEAHRELIRAFARAGDRAQASRHYREFARLMRDELGSPPSPETQALSRQLRQGQAI